MYVQILQAVVVNLTVEITQGKKRTEVANICALHHSLQGAARVIAPRWAPLKQTAVPAIMFVKIIQNPLLAVIIVMLIVMCQLIAPKISNDLA